MEVVETALADKRTVDYRRVEAGNCPARMVILVNPFVILPSNQIHVLTILAVT